MSGGNACQCAQRKKPVNKRRWLVMDRNCNYSAFNGYRKTFSDYSAIRCMCCGAYWRTKSRYVDYLDDAEQGDVYKNNDWNECDKGDEGDEDVSKDALTMMAAEIKEQIDLNGGAIYEEDGTKIVAEFMCSIRASNVTVALQKNGVTVNRDPFSRRIEIRL